MNKKRIGIIAGIIFGALTIISAGTVLAAQVLTHHGSVTVTGSSSPPLSYTFKVYDAATLGTEITDGDSAFFALGSISANTTTQKTIYLASTGTGAVTVTPSATWSGPAAGVFTFSPASVTLSDSGRQSIAVTFSAGTAPAGPVSFDIIYAGSP